MELKKNIAFLEKYMKPKDQANLRITCNDEKSIIIKK